MTQAHDLNRECRSVSLHQRCFLLQTLTARNNQFASRCSVLLRGAYKTTKKILADQGAYIGKYQQSRIARVLETFHVLQV